MSWSLARAASEAGLSKSTISRAIKAGKVSASRQDDGTLLVDPAELFRVYPRTKNRTDAKHAHDAVRNRGEDTPATYSAEVEILKVKVTMLEAMLAREQETVADLRLRLDTATHKALALSKPLRTDADAVHEAMRTTQQRSLWDRLRGR